MASPELDLTAAQAYELDSTDETIRDDEEKDATDETINDDDEGEKVSMDADSTDETREKFGADSTDETREKFGADSTDETQEKFGPSINASGSKIPASEIVIRTIAVERTAPLADLPVDANAAFGQWLGNSGLAPSKH